MSVCRRDRFEGPRGWRRNERAARQAPAVGETPPTRHYWTMIRVVFLRHGESEWNKENRFTGWTDVDLSEKGRAEAKNAGKKLKAEGYVFDLAFTSVLKRAVRTLWMALDEMDLMWIPVINSWRLNERHYGEIGRAHV